MWGLHEADSPPAWALELAGLVVGLWGLVEPVSHLWNRGNDPARSVGWSQGKTAPSGPAGGEVHSSCGVMVTSLGP